MCTCPQNVSSWPRGSNGSIEGGGYQSKLDEFSSFLTRVRYAPLALRAAPAIAQPSQRSQTQPPAGSSQPGSSQQQQRAAGQQGKAPPPEHCTSHP